MNYNINLLEKTLYNGCKVILVQKPEYIRSLCMLATKVGGFDIHQYIQGKAVMHPTGCAHFLEHQMFRYRGQDVTDLFAKMQAQTNAFTSYTQTAYYFQTTADVKEPLHLLFDFVQNLDIDESSVNKEKGIILSEYDMYQESPEQRLIKETWNSLYWNHPMHIDILGTREDIQNMTVDQLSYFYKNNYDPSRLVFVGITGKDIHEMMDEIEEIQKDVPSIVKGEVSRIMDPEPREVKRTHFEMEMDISIPFVAVAYKLEPKEDALENEKLDLSCQMYLDAYMSALNPDYQSWLDQRIITQVTGAECDFSSDHAYILFYGQTMDPNAFVDIVDQVVTKIQKESLDEEVYQCLRARILASNIRNTDQYENMAVDLIHAEIEGTSFWNNLDLIRTLTKSDIEQRVHSLDFSQRSVTTILPKSSNEENNE